MKGIGIYVINANKSGCVVGEVRLPGDGLCRRVAFLGPLDAFSGRCYMPIDRVNALQQGYFLQLSPLVTKPHQSQTTDHRAVTIA